MTSLAGILAASGTLLLALFTWRLASDTKKLAVETGDDVSSQFRPVVVVSRSNQIHVIVTEGQQLAEFDVQFHNVGAGPALNMGITITSKSSVDERFLEETLGTLGPDSRVNRRFQGILFRDTSGNEETALRLFVRASYEDVAGREHVSRFDYFDEERGRRSWPVTQGSTETFPMDLITTEIDPEDERVKVLWKYRPWVRRARRVYQVPLERIRH